MAGRGEQLLDIGDGRLIRNRSGGVNICHDGRTHHQERRETGPNGAWQANFKCAQCSKHRLQVHADSSDAIVLVWKYSEHLPSCEPNEAAIAGEEGRLVGSCDGAQTRPAVFWSNRVATSI